MKQIKSAIDENDLKLAIQHLVSAIDHLEETIDAHIERKKSVPSVEDEMADILLDRSRLIQSLDRAEAKSQRFEDANKEVSRRLVNAMESIRVVIEARSE